MNVNKNGIPIAVKSHRQKRYKPPKEVIDMVRYSQVVDGVPVEIIIPDFSPIRAVLAADGWTEEFLNKDSL